jgi:serine/threonine-protein kinase
MIGKTVAHYKIVEKIGAGGMGEVWRAGDSKLGRDVALKMLPPVFAQDAERMARFQREAKVLASLNHPNIAAIYGLEEVDDARFLVLELVDGPTLADRMAQGRLPVSEALGIAQQIAEAVENAHESGVIHRDLKPANVKLTADGRVKVLDFGLAKALEDPTTSSPEATISDASPTLSPTLSSPITGALTGANVILGTAAYMSPEQARGQAVDKRSDIWSFGVVLFEMLTGQRHFDGETVSDTLAAVLRKQPDWELLTDDVPAPIRRLLRRCLERKAKNRLRDIGDARIVIGEVLSGAAAEEETTAPGAEPTVDSRPSRPWLLPVVALAAAAITFAVVSLVRPTPEPPPLRKFATPYPADVRPGPAALSPDASAIAYVEGSRLMLNELTTLEVRELDTRNGISPPFWSPDGEWVAYGSGAGLWKVRRSGGQPVRIATAPHDISDVAGGTWRADGRILFTTGSTGVLEVSAQGGEPRVAIAPAEGETDFHEMADLEGRAVAVIVHGPTGFDAIDALSESGQRSRIVSYPGESLYDVTWSPTGHVLFARRGNAEGIWAIPFSLSSLETEGAAFLVAPGGVDPSVADDGTLCYVSGSPQQASQVGLVDRSGNVMETIGPPADYHHYPSLSPDGRTIACRIRDGETTNLWMIDVDRGSQRRFTQGPGRHEWGSWDPTGESFWYYDQQWSVAPELYVMPANGTGEPRVVTHGHLPHVSPDGRWLLFTKLDIAAADQDDVMDLWLLDLKREDAEPQPFVEEPADQWVTDISPTAPLVAYATNASGRWEIHLTTYPDRSGDWPASTRGGWWPQWKGDGSELFYAVGDSIMSVEVDAGDGRATPKLSRPRFLFRRPRYDALTSGFPDGFEVMPDGQSFVLHLTLEQEEDVEPSLVVVQNWIKEFEDGIPGQ